MIIMKLCSHFPIDFCMHFDLYYCHFSLVSLSVGYQELFSPRWPSGKGIHVATMTLCCSGIIRYGMSLEKGYYGFKQSLQLWFQKLSSVLSFFGFSRFQSNYSFFVRKIIWTFWFVIKLQVYNVYLMCRHFLYNFWSLFMVVLFHASFHKKSQNNSILLYSIHISNTLYISLRALEIRLLFVVYPFLVLFI